ncbi:ATP-binding protein [Duganella aquatilis]|nr:ATP-binding protein [Duganella aquatilis]
MHRNDTPASLAQDQQRLAVMLDSVSDAIITIDDQGIIEYANRGAQELFGYPSQELLGVNVAMLMPAPDSARHDHYIRAYLKTGQSRVMHHRRSVNGLRKDGTVIPLDLTLGQVMENGQQKFTGVMRDVTEQRRLQALAADAERRLQEAKDRADEANQAKSTFLATMSHEIRTPMNGVLGALDLLALDHLSGAQRDTVGMATQSARELLRILDDILDFSKIEAGRMELRQERTSVRSDVIDKVIATHASTSAAKGLQLATRIDAALAPTLCVDPLRLRQILHNFVSNAVKFTHQGGVELSLQVLATTTSAQTLRFAVRDTGIGISAADQARLFHPFVQAEGDTTRRYGGSGLGLAICMGLAASMGGAITMHSAPGVGTTMLLELTLPISARPGDSRLAGAAMPPPRVRPAPGVDQAVREHSLVLVVDDHATNRTILLRQLDALGYAAESASNGLEALALLASGRHALLISDCQMPEMDGYTLARTIRRQEAEHQRPALPIIAFTANAFAGDAERALQAGMNDYLAKPTTMAALHAVLKRYLPIGNSAASLDEAHLAQLSGGDTALRAAILDEFRAACEVDALALAAAGKHADLDGMVHVAHRIRGAARAVGAVSLAEAGAQLEQQARAQRDGQPVSANGLSATAAALLRLHTELAAWRRVPPP